MRMKESSRRMPKPLIVTTGKFSRLWLTMGSPYQVYRRQFRSAMVYGTHENSSVLFFFMTLENVNLWTTWNCQLPLQKVVEKLNRLRLCQVIYKNHIRRICIYICTNYKNFVLMSCHYTLELRKEATKQHSLQQTIWFVRLTNFIYHIFFPTKNTRNEII